MKKSPNKRDDHGPPHSCDVENGDDKLSPTFPISYRERKKEKTPITPLIHVMDHHGMMLLYIYIPMRWTVQAFIFNQLFIYLFIYDSICMLSNV